MKIENDPFKVPTKRNSLSQSSLSGNSSLTPLLEKVTIHKKKSHRCKTNVYNLKNKNTVHERESLCPPGYAIVCRYIGT